MSMKTLQALSILAFSILASCEKKHYTLLSQAEMSENYGDDKKTADKTDQPDAEKAKKEDSSEKQNKDSDKSADKEKSSADKQDSDASVKSEDAEKSDSKSEDENAAKSTKQTDKQDSKASEKPQDKKASEDEQTVDSKTKGKSSAESMKQAEKKNSDAPEKTEASKNTEKPGNSEKPAPESKTLAAGEKKKAKSPASDSEKFPDITLIPADFPLPAPRLLPVTKKIHSLLKDDLPANAEGMKPYQESVPELSETPFKMVPIPDGKATIGSPEDEAGRDKDERIVKNLKIAPFWMADTETTWALYQIFMESPQARNKDGSINYDSDIYSSEDPELDKAELTDVISQPTPAYMGMHFNMGKGGYSAEYPAISMTQHAASKFCEWLTAQTGHYYRLPTEAEWEYACRAGTRSAYSFGDDSAELADYGWTEENADYEYHPVGEKKANPWGLQDMHGNVAEWCLDYSLPEHKGVQDGNRNPLPVSPKRYPHVSKGGHWDTSADEARSAARLPSKSAWKDTDPQIPKSLWYHTDAPFIGFRVVRPLAKPSVKEMHTLWNLGPGTID